MTSTNRCAAVFACTAGLLGSPLLWAAEAQPGLSYGANLKITAQSLDDRDLGTRDGGDFNGVGLSVRPWVYGLRGDWSAYLMAEAFVASDVIESDTSESDTIDSTDARERDDNFLALHEFWVDYGGLTAYPGESLRLGRQKIRSVDGLWWDSNIEALRWNFDTTLLNAHVGIAERFSDYRTDLDDLAPQDEDRLHLLGDLSTQWRPGHWAGLKFHHSDDNGSLPNPGEEVDQLSKTYSGQLTWLGIEANGDFYNYRSSLPLSYMASLTWLTGDADVLSTRTVDGVRRAAGESNQDVDAWALDLGLRWNIDEHWRLGATYSRASGGGDGDDSEQFVQTDLQSNRANFTGTNSTVNRFGEAYRGELNNLQAASLFGAWQLNKDYDASLVYHRFWRVDDQADSASGLQAALEPGEKDLGQEVDLVLTRYFNEGQMPAELGWLGAKSALVRFRGGLFLPGDAFSRDSDSNMHRAVVDVVWRY
ncbi:transcriptional regulator [Pseudomonas sp. R-28-1W-6]|uniref:alginate export family protein n=1 Tax=Pseudomonas sp. R-28-1W-6 TaxID=2650101 RepID=UPI001365C485|nr:alginate export family protein [Pseudomonas sp. R-28-1W-6]MWV12668.1 transcriptional regulator [Pseudomonas sp. R-28-1W-6]